MKEFSLPSQHGKLRGVVWDEVVNPIGTVQIIHGLVEYHGRYQETAEYLNKNGFMQTAKFKMPFRKTFEYIYCNERNK